MSDPVLYKGQIMIYAGIALIVISVILLLVCSIVFKKKRKKMMEKIYNE